MPTDCAGWKKDTGEIRQNDGKGYRIINRIFSLIRAELVSVADFNFQQLGLSF